MSDRAALQSLEQLLESFLERAVAAKGERLSVLEGMNRLDDIAKTDGTSQLSSIGDWLADHSGWLADHTLRPADKRRITEMLTELRDGIQSNSPESEKIDTEIERWQSHLVKSSGGLVLKRGPEQAVDTNDTIAQFQMTLTQMSELYREVARSRPHLMSVLDDLLKMAELQRNRQALLLAGFLLYYLRQAGYTVEPYVKRLKEAEKLIPTGKPHA